MSEIQGMGPPDTQPEKAIPLPPVPSPPSLPNLKSWAPLYLSNMDKTIEHLSRVLSTPSGTDTLLLTLGYSTLLTSTVLTTISVRALNARMSRLMTTIANLPPNTTVLIKDTKIPSSRLLRLGKSLKALSSLISDFRIFARLWGLVGIYKWGKGVHSNPPKDITQRRIAYLQVLVNILFQALENAAYLASKNVIGWSTQTQNKLWVWSSRFWAAHVGLEFWRLAYEMGRQSGGKEQRRLAGDAWWRSLLSNCAWAPLTLHWSSETGLIGDSWVGAFGSVAGVTALRQVWKNTAV